MVYAMQEFGRLGVTCAIVSLALFINIRTVNSDAVGWNYKPEGLGGPGKWYISYPDCGGVMQSPININSTEVLFDPNLELFDLSDYKKTENINMVLENVGGHTAEVLLSGEPVYLKSGGLPDKYRLAQFHFHWGGDDSKGSEHTLNGEDYPMEAHFVHYQDHLHNLTYAAPHSFGLAVVAVFFKVGNYNPKYEQLLKYFDKIKVADTSTPIPTFAVADLLPPSNRFDYFRYFGSLTTPPCHESVIWSALTDLVEISEDQLNTFRSLLDEEQHQLVNDFRPVQPINQRAVLTTHPKYKPWDESYNDAGNIVSSSTTTLFVAMLCLAIFLF